MSDTTDTIPGDAIALPDLLGRVSMGDRAAFQGLYERMAPRLFALAQRVTADQALATEALHATLIQIWRRSVTFDPLLGTAEGWLVAQLRQRAIDIVRRRQRSGMPSGVFTRDPQIESGLARLAATPQGERMRAALTTLDSQQREILVMAFLDGLSSAELAQKLHLPIGTIKSWTRRSLALLSAALEPPA